MKDIPKARKRAVLSVVSVCAAIGGVFACALAGHEPARSLASPGTTPPQAQRGGAPASSAQRPAWLPPHVSLNVPGGVYIPIKEVHDVSFVRLSHEPLTLIAAEVVGNSDSNETAILKTVGPVHLDNGMVLGEQCAEHLRIGDTVIEGAVQNASAESVILVGLSDGTQVELRPKEGLFIGDFRAAKPGEVSMISTHHWECECTCSTGPNGASATVTWDCTTCEPTGDQCKGSNGGACRFDPDGDGPQGEVEGTLKNCRVILVPNLQTE